MQPQRLFVYGTLRRDRDMQHTRFSQDGEVLGLGRIRGTMYNLGAFPGVQPMGAGKVTGQVIDFSDLDRNEWGKYLGRTDAYEGVPHLYRREQVVVEMEGGDFVEAWVYYFNQNADDFALIPSGNWLERS